MWILIWILILAKNYERKQKQMEIWIFDIKDLLLTS